MATKTTKSPSTAIRSGKTILQTAAGIIKRNKEPLSPKQIALLGIRSGKITIPRGRTNGYVTQLLQSTLYNDASYAARPTVFRLRPGVYTAL